MPKYFLKFYKLFNILNSKVKDSLSKLLFKDIGYNPMIISVLINCFLFLLLLLLTTPVYRSNDDIILNLTSAGFFGKGNTEFLLFGNIILGKLLKLFYSISSQYNWYLIFLIFTQFISHIIILYYLLKANNKYFTIFIYICMFFIFSINLFTEINFSGSSLIALSGALVIIFSILNKKHTNFLDYVLLFFLFTISLLIRKDTFYIYCFIFLLFPILYFNRWKTILFIFSISFISFVFVYSYNGSYYKKKDPLQLEYRKAGRIMIDGIVKPTIPELSKLGWDKEDYEIYASFKGIDNIFYSKSSVISLSKEISYKIDYKKILFAPYSLVLYIIGDIYYYSTGLILILVLFYFMRKTLRFFFLINSIWVIIFFILGIIAVHYRQYVYYAILFYLTTIGIFYAIQRANSGRLQIKLREKINYVTVLMVILIVVSLTNIVHNNLPKRNSVYAGYDNKAIELMNSDKIFLIVGQESDYFFGKWSIFKSIKNNSDDRLKERIVPLGWFINSIQFESIIKGSVIQKLISGNIYFLGKDDQLFDNLERFIFKHYSIMVSFEEINDYKYSKVYKLINQNI